MARCQWAGQRRLLRAVGPPPCAICVWLLRRACCSYPACPRCRCRRRRLSRACCPSRARRTWMTLLHPVRQPACPFFPPGNTSRPKCEDFKRATSSSRGRVCIQPQVPIPALLLNRPRPRRQEGGGQVLGALVQQVPHDCAKGGGPAGKGDTSCSRDPGPGPRLAACARMRAQRLGCRFACVLVS